MSLTYIQRIAVRGDVGKLVNTIYNREEDIPFVCFMCLTVYSSEYFEEVKKVLTESFGPEVVERMYYYVTSRVVPYNIWADKCVAEFKAMLNICKEQRDFDMVRSIFCNYLYRVQEVSLTACHVLLSVVLKDEGMLDLHKDAFYLNNNIPFPEKIQVEEDNPNEAEITSKFFSESLIFGLAIAGTDVLPIDEPTKESGLAEDDEEEIQGKTDEDVYDSLLERYKNVSESTYFIVRKKELATGEIVSTREFTTIQDVIFYLKMTSQNNPELSKTYQFVIMEVGGNGLSE